LAFCLPAISATTPNTVTFTKNVAVILQKNCQGCHRPGEPAPMPLLTYRQARPWAKAIKEAVLLKKMPPWFADPHYGEFRNDRSLSKADIDTLAAWADAGAPEGDPKELPPPVAFIDGWNIGKPDVEFQMPNGFSVPASGAIDYQYVVVPTNFTADRWVQMAEIRPGSRAVVHHVIAFVRSPESKWMRDAKPGIPFVPQKRVKGERDETFDAEFLVGYAPGTMPEMLEPGRAKLIRAGSDIVFQLHYTANGQPASDQSKVGMIFAKEPPKERVMTLVASNDTFTIPPGAPDHRVDADFEFGTGVKLIAMFPHMHLRGKDFEFRAVYPDGATRKLLSVPRYSFSWQLSYYPVRDIVLPKGARIECTAHFDNSLNNPVNPDATKDVSWGDQSWEEMMIGFLDVAFDAGMDVKKLFPEKKDEKKSSTD
jgi:hypothetical protein